jgi:hypothetical protein
MKISFLLSLLLLALPPCASAQDSRLLPADSLLTATRWPENHGVRVSVRDIVLGSLAQEGGAGSGRVLVQPESGARVKFKVLSQKNARYYLFLNEGETGYPIAGQGNMIIKRSLENGRFLQMKVFLRDREDCFVRLFPRDGRSSLDVYFYGHRLYQQVMLPLSFDTLLFAPFRQVMRLTATAVDWPLLLYRGERDPDSRVEAVLERIRPLLSELPDLDDGAMDEAGRFVRISDGVEVEAGGFNCSGFAKWVTDGFYYPLTGRLLDPVALKEKHLSLRGNRWSERHEEERDPYFGLDWSRNLAVLLANARAPQLHRGPEAMDVREVPFLRYTEDIGYAVGELELLLYLESREHPGFFYIGSLNRDTGTEPVLRQHFHLVVLFPYFDGGGSFRVAVLERNRETSLDELMKRNPNDYIHLVRLDARGPFIPTAFHNSTIE